VEVLTLILGNLMFIHIPKTGGNSVWYTIRHHGGYRLKEKYGPGAGYALHHSSWGVRERMGTTEYDRYEKFSLVRNPWERAVSLYYGADWLTHHSVDGFNMFMTMKRSEKNLRWSPLRLQTDLLGPEVRIFDLANIDQLYKWMGAKLQIKIKPQGVITTGKNRYIERPYHRDLIPGKWAQRIAAANRKDIKRFHWRW